MSPAEDIAQEGPSFDAETFLAWVERQHERHELVDGVARTMPGGSLNHARLSLNALTALAARLGAGPFEVFGGDLAVILGARHVVLPDVSVSCEPVAEMGVDRPVVIVEILSPSTAAYDLGDKAAAYRRTPSLRHLVLISQDRIHIRHFHRGGEEQEFSLTEIDRVDGVLALGALGVEITIPELYARVTVADVPLARGAS